ncbi:CoA-binding protein [Nitrosophilus alvini]|uniref:CoA-binding protein n=1 Tax=Nitrosophilus alvini TaxID=2714855 RepID=UPI00190ADE74|nr:CoA-binding protein [Nitrosophilus alvini]
MECEIPSINADKKTIKKIFEDVETIAVVGLSPNPLKDSHRVAKYLQEQGYKIIPVYPKGGEILGEKVYRSLEEIPERIDMIDIFRKSEAVTAIVESAIKRGDVKVVWMQKEIVNNEAAAKAKNAGIEAVQNMCAMIEHKILFA